MTREPTDMELRVCEAITIDLCSQPTPIKRRDDGSTYIEFDTRSAARAAIRSMRDPTDAMHLAGLDADYKESTALVVYQSMIDAASPPYKPD